MTFFSFIICVYVIAQGAILGRADGSDLLGLSEWTERLLIMFFFFAACSFYMDAWALLALLGVVGMDRDWETEEHD